MLQHGEDVREGSRLADEMSDASFCQLYQILLLVTCIVHKQSSEVLFAVVRIGHTKLAVAASAVTSYSKEGGLLTQIGHIAKRIGHICTIREGFSLGGMRD